MKRAVSTRRVLVWLAAACCAGCMPWLPASVARAADASTPIAIRDARIVTVSGPELAKGTVLLRNGLIEEVGTSVSIPPDAWVIDGTGLIVYPGFIDGLSTWGIPAAAAPASTAPPKPVHGPEDRPQTYAFERAADLISPSDRRIGIAQAAGYASAATFPNKGIFEGQGALVNLAGQRAGDMVVAEPIGQQVALRFGAGGMGRAFPSSLMGNISYVRQLYLDLAQYQQAKAMYASHPAGLKRPEYDHDLEGLAQSPRLLLPADQVQQIDRMIHFGKELKVPFVLYGLHEAFKSVNELKAANVPVLVSLKWPEAPRNADPYSSPNYRDLAMRDQAPGVPAELAKAGVKFGFFSDGLESAPDLRKAVKKAISAGLDRAAAVRALTLSVAEIYGVSDRLGSVEKGKIANLVVTRGEAFEEKSTVEYLFIDGQQFQPSKDLQQAPPQGSGASGTRRATPAVEDGGNQ